MLQSIDGIQRCKNINLIDINIYLLLLAVIIDKKISETLLVNTNNCKHD